MQHDCPANCGESIALPSEFVPDFRGQVCREDRLIALPGSLVVSERQTHTGHGHARRVTHAMRPRALAELTAEYAYTSMRIGESESGMATVKFGEMGWLGWMVIWGLS
jgi:hypothetical protein